MALPTLEIAPAQNYYERLRLTQQQIDVFRTVYDGPAQIGQLVLFAHIIALENTISGREAALLMREAAVQTYEQSDSRRAKISSGCLRRVRARTSDE